MKLTKRLLLSAGTLIALLSIFITACQKQVSPASNTNSPKNLSLYLTDDPCNYDSVFIDIKYVEVKIDTSTQHMDDDHYGDDDRDGDDDHLSHDQYGKWDTLAINPGLYNISKLRNGVDTLLGTAHIPFGKIRKIRISLGINNSVVIAGISNPLSLFPGINNYVYVKLHDEDEDEDNRNSTSTIQTSIWLDFNICESIKMMNGKYYLKPVLKPFCKQNFGEIEGKVFPFIAQPTVIARNATDSASAIPERDGEYKIRGLRQGVYSVTFKAGAAGYKDTTVANIQVQNGKDLKLPSITLHQ